jgi:hypothetical protein
MDELARPGFPALSRFLFLRKEQNRPSSRPLTLAPYPRSDRKPSRRNVESGGRRLSKRAASGLKSPGESQLSACTGHQAYEPSFLRNSFEDFGWLAYS